MLKAMLCVLPPMFKSMLQVAEFWFEYSWRGSQLLIAWGRGGGGGGGFGANQSEN